MARAISRTEDDGKLHWVRVTFRLDPWSYRAILRRMKRVSDANVAKGGQPINRSQALRHILRRAKT